MPYNISLNNIDAKKWITRQCNPWNDRIRLGEDIRIVDLFSGCGGLTYGVVEAALANGYNPIIELAIDNNVNALNVYKANFEVYSNNVLNQNITDLFQFNSSMKLNNCELELKERIGNVDVLVAGPPCQGHSNLNNSTRGNDPRNKLYLSCVQAIKILMPSFVIIENVPSVVNSKENVVEITKESLSTLGYSYREFKIDFLRLGIPQSRKRHIIVASKNQEFIAELFIDDSDFNRPRLSDYISDLEDVQSNGSVMNSSGKITRINKKRIDYLFDNDLYDLPNDQRPNCHRTKQHSYKSNYGRLNYSLPAQTITSGFGSMGQGRYVHPTQRRTISVREAARIQGFSDDFIFDVNQSLTEIRKMIANAVPPQLSYVLVNHYIESIN
ncbi:DNA cytosine methyltransferase [Marinifilum fragile]|uniref:DNA cytosine methyltransferase n=1 Tax=Marinifilum fragile TaxID=570161 RepID=UPI002AA7BD12|nr:DNA cytosine methyltransferase [Marinifilum fragile]